MKHAQHSLLPSDLAIQNVLVGWFWWLAGRCYYSSVPPENKTKKIRFKRLRIMLLQTFPLKQIASDELLTEGLAQVGGRALDNDTGGLKGLDLGVGITLAAGDDGTGVAHAAARGSGDTGDEGDDGLAAVLGVVLLEEIGSLLLGGTTDLTDHDDTVGLAVLEEDLEAVDEVGTAEGVTADADDEGLAEAGLGGLVDGLVGEGAGSGDNTDAAALVDETGHDTDLALAGGDDARAVGTDETGLGLGPEHRGDANHVCDSLLVRFSSYARFFSFALCPCDPMY